MPRTVQAICSDLDIEVVPTATRRRPGQTCAARTLERIRDVYGEAHLIVVLRSIAESRNNANALTAPVLWAISDMVRAHPDWVETGLRWLEAMDDVELETLHQRAKANRLAVPPRRAIATMLFERLSDSFAPDHQRNLL